ncbi:LysR family transcriptional regulator [Aphanizomenon sp. UHCC 0183]|uniref:LysR family transcriptional regulator n=1 Tax=Aphanizomenon sp. UHCC 0183 TaxID=2590028 RepID=UPI001447334B|nr:LysR family transcriptional regulator [Aphanizomenon sp. UHCC 0183]
MFKFQIEFKYSVPISKTLTLGTLGPSGTSSEAALKYLISQIEQEKIKEINVLVKLFDSFIDLQQALKNEQVDLALVPHAYERINEFYMQPKFDLGFIFVCPTPVYGLAKRKDQEFKVIGSKIVTHPAPLPLLSELLPLQYSPQEMTVELVNSTSVAAKQVHQGLADLAITNEKARQYYDLEFVSIYGTIPMSWSVFYKKPAVAYV